MKQKLALGLTALMMASTSFAISARTIKQNHENKREKQAQNQKSASGNTHEQNEHMKRVDTIARSLGLNSSRLLEGTKKEVDVEMTVKKDPNDTSKSPKMVKTTVRVNGKELFERLATKLENGDGNPKAVEMGFHLISQMANTSSGARRAENGVTPKTPEQIASDTREFFKFTSDYVDAVTRSPRQGEKLEDIKAEVDSYVEAAQGLASYQGLHPNAKVDELYEKGMSASARKRQRDCARG